MGANQDAVYLYGVVPRKPVGGLPNWTIRYRVIVRPRKYAHLVILTATALFLCLIQVDGDQWKAGPMLRARPRAKERRRLLGLIRVAPAEGKPS